MDPAARGEHPPEPSRLYCLRPNRTDFDEQTLWKTCVMLTGLEAVFRSFKSELGPRPIPPRTPERAAGRLFITMLAY